MKILYFGTSHVSSTSLHRAEALRRVGHSVRIADPYIAIRGCLSNRLLRHFHFKTGYRFVQTNLFNWVHSLGPLAGNFDLIWVDSGELLGHRIVAFLKKSKIPVVLYNLDDPTGARDGNRWDSLLDALSLYDLCYVVRDENVAEFKSRGAARILRGWRSYDEVAHRPYENIKDIPRQFISGVAFVGTWMRNEHRDEFLLKLMERRIPLAIWGDRWQKAPHWAQIRPFHRGGALCGREYVAALQGSNVCIGLLSKGNRDLHTQRSLEIPYCGGLFCGERTSEHEFLYRDGLQAVFWNDAEECAHHCQKLLADPEQREAICLAGQKRVRELKLGNEDVCRRILAEL